MKRIFIAGAGAVCLVAGITLTLAWWPEVVSLFKGVGGMALALGGMLMLYLSRE